MKVHNRLPKDWKPAQPRPLSQGHRWFQALQGRSPAEQVNAFRQIVRDPSIQRELRVAAIQEAVRLRLPRDEVRLLRDLLRRTP